MATEHERAGLVLVRREELVLLQAVERAAWHLPNYRAWRALRPEERTSAQFHEWERSMYEALDALTADALTASVRGADAEGRAG